MHKVNLTYTSNYVSEKNPDDQLLQILNEKPEVIKFEKEKSNSFHTDTCDGNSPEAYSIVFKKKPIGIFSTNGAVRY